MSEPLIKSVNPTFFLRKTNWDQVIQNYNQGKYAVIQPTAQKTVPTAVPSTYQGKIIKQNNRPIGFQVQLPGTLLIVRGRENSYGICANCRTDTTGFCSIGVPYCIKRTETKEGVTIEFGVDGETCSTECSLSYYKKMGGHKISMSVRYLDSEHQLRLLHYLLFKDFDLREAPEITQLIPFGDKSVAEYRKKLHMYSEYKELNFSNLDAELGKKDEGQVKIMLN